MFNNRFNSTKKDPLVEAVQSAMQDGEIRRQAEALVNEEFGVYSRQAVVREQLAAYDARLEEAYKCMKEGEKLAKKDYDKDGKVESPKDEVWGSRFRAAKMAGKMEEEQMEEGRVTGPRSYKGSPDRKRKAVQMALGRKHKDHPDWNPRTNPQHSALTLGRKLQKQGVTEEEQIDELKKPTAKTAMQALHRAGAQDDMEGNWNRSNRLFSWKQKNLPGKSARNQKSTGKAKLPDVSNTDFHKDGYSGHFTKKGKLTKSATKDTKADIKRRLGKHTAPNLPEEAMNEAAYSAKAARAGKDIGKPGKMFAKIAKKAGEKYGSEERGKNVAGAILKRIRAKHMKEEQIDEIVVQKSQMRPGETLGQAMNRLTGKTAIKGGANDPTSSKFRGPTTSAPKSATTPSSASVSARTIPTAPKKAMGPEVDPVTAGYDKPAKTASAPEPKAAPMPTMAQSDVGPKLGAGTGAGTTFSTPGGSVTPSAPEIKQGAEKMKTMSSLKESVQVGDYKYRII